ncbi:hypothetical protein PanWU01x14_007790, partial [Parasponia andersonii]
LLDCQVYGSFETNHLREGCDPTFSNLIDLVVAAQKAEAFLNNRSATRDRSRNKGNERKMNKKSQGQWQGQNSQNSGSSNSSGSSGRSRYGPYRCFNYGQQGTRRKLAPTVNRDLHCLKKDHREVRVPQFLFRAVK